MEGFEKVANRSDIKPGALQVYEVQGEPIVLTELKGELIAFANVCTHEDCDLVFEGEGEIDENNEIECDCHGSRFNVLTGEVANPPATVNIPVYAVRVDGDDVLIGPA